MVSVGEKASVHEILRCSISAVLTGSFELSTDLITHNLSSVSAINVFHTRTPHTEIAQAEPLFNVGVSELRTLESMVKIRAK